tara:strand:+ start:7710 stop:8345 length:636 start_codon:yes stop_codon:yes gene_type:complete
MSKIYMKSQGQQYSSSINNGEEQVNSVNWDANYDGDKAVVNVDSNIDGKKKREKKVLTNKDLDAMFSIPAVDESIADRITADFLQPHRFAPRGSECRPTLVPVDMNDPALKGYPNIEHQAYVIPPLGLSREEMKERDRLEYGILAPPAGEALYSKGLLGDYVRSFSLRNKGITRLHSPTTSNTSNTTRKKRRSSKSKSNSKSKKGGRRGRR